MAFEIQCRCGHRLRIGAGASRGVECPGCGRLFVLADGGRALRLAIAVAAGFAVIAVGLLGALIGSSRAPGESGWPARAEPARPPVERPVPPAIEPVPEPAPINPMPAAVPVPAPLPVPEARPEVIEQPRAGVLAASIEPAGRYKIGDVLRQDVIFSRKTATAIAGVDFRTSAEYSIQSSIVISKVNADGSLVATQTIVATKLISADDELKANLRDALAKVSGTKFTIAVEANGDVTEVKGVKEPLRLLPGQVAGRDGDPAQSLRIWSLPDANAWRDLAVLTFFQPEGPLIPRASWSRVSEHDWGPLGQWSGKRVFVCMGRLPGRAARERIDYRYDLVHRPPAAGADRDLHAHLSNIEFRIVGAGGAILYDPARSRATAAEELFRVKGAMIVTLNGLNAPLALEEEQSFRLTIGGPNEQALVGQPPASRK